MRAVTLASVRVYARRYVAAVIAVALAVGFVVTTSALTSSAKAGLLADLGASFRGAEAVVTVRNVSDAERARLRIESLGGDAAVNATAWTSATTEGHRLADNVPLGTIAEKGLRWQELTSGAYPTRPGEAVVDVHEAATHHLGLGDEITVGLGDAELVVVVTGTVASSKGPHAAAAYVSWSDLRTLGDDALVTDVVTSGVPLAALDAGLPRRYGVAPVEAHLVGLQQDITRQVDVIGLMMLVFAAVALFVAVLVITNTFSVLLAQRQRDFALLRCVGATRRQVLRAVRLEALLVGGVSSLIGLALGAGFGHGLVALAGRLFPTLLLGPVELSPQWLAGSWLLGVVVTLGASLLPARRGSRVAPLAALRPEVAVVVRSRAGGARIALAALAIWGGAALLWRSMQGHDVVPMLAGGFVSFVGILLLGPIIVPLAIRTAGVPVGWLGGATGRLAVSNAVRNPRRTAATAASLLTGVTLITGMVVGMATVRTTVDAEMDAQYPLDAIVTSGDGPVTAATAVAVADVEGVSRVEQAPGVTAVVSAAGQPGAELTLVSPPRQAASVVHGSPDFLAPDPGEIWMSWEVFRDSGFTPGTKVRVTTGGTTQRFTAEVGDGWGDAAILSAVDLATLTTSPAPRALWIQVEDGADPEDVAGALEAIARASGAGGGRWAHQPRLHRPPARHHARFGPRSPRHRRADRCRRGRLHARPVGAGTDA